jgi:hypothetical protein
MDQRIARAFFDELEKISFRQQLSSAAERLGSSGKWNLVKYPLMVGGGIAGWEHLKRMKRRYDIGKAVEQAQAARGG